MFFRFFPFSPCFPFFTEFNNIFRYYFIFAIFTCPHPTLQSHVLLGITYNSKKKDKKKTEKSEFAYVITLWDFFRDLTITGSGQLRRKQSSVRCSCGCLVSENTFCGRKTALDTRILPDITEVCVLGGVRSKTCATEQDPTIGREGWWQRKN